MTEKGKNRPHFLKRKGVLYEDLVHSDEFLSAFVDSSLIVSLTLFGRSFNNVCQGGSSAMANRCILTNKNWFILLHKIMNRVHNFRL